MAAALEGASADVEARDMQMATLRDCLADADDAALGRVCSIVGHLCINFLICVAIWGICVVILGICVVIWGVSVVTLGVCVVIIMACAGGGGVGGGKSGC